MLNGEWTEELEFLYDAYEEKFGIPPDEHEEIMYEEFTYEEFVSCIRECLKTGQNLDELLENRIREIDILSPIYTNNVCEE